jgi:hypothetical protein
MLSGLLRAAPVALSAALLASPLACSKSDSPDKSPAPSAAPAPTSAPTAVTPTAAPSADGPGPIVTIPAGKLIAGTACGDHPRMPSEEPAGVSFDLGEFTIDAYPYPNDPAQPPRTGVTQAQAKASCEARGRRLCTELEWERACKGPTNTKYEYGNRFDGKKCPTGTGPLGPAGSHEGCKSAFGVSAMHGFVWEWTSSAWGRGEEGSSVALRGGFGSSPYAHMRCSSAKAAAPDESSKTIGFRCCGGPENGAKVDLPAPAEEVSALEAVEPLDDALAARIKRAMANGQMKEEPGFEHAFGKVWRWRPVRNEELHIASVIKKPAGGGAALTQPVVVQLCERTALLVSRLKGPVEELGDAVLKESPDKGSTEVTMTLKAGADAGEVRFTYRFGQVNIAQPPWVKEGGPAGADAGAPDAGGSDAGGSDAGN